MKEFCKSCEQLLQKNFFTNKIIGYEFKDGYYCEQCATIKIKTARGER